MRRGGARIFKDDPVTQVGRSARSTNLLRASDERLGGRRRPFVGYCDRKVTSLRFCSVEAPVSNTKCPSLLVFRGYVGWGAIGDELHEVAFLLGFLEFN